MIITVAIPLDAEELRVLDQAVADYRSYERGGFSRAWDGFDPHVATRESVIEYWTVLGLMDARLGQGKAARGRGQRIAAETALPAAVAGAEQGGSNG